MSPEWAAAEAAVLDTCALINLAVMPCGVQLLASLPQVFHVPEQVIHRSIGHRRPQQDCRTALLAKVVPCRLEHPSEYKLFADLVGREGAQGLGDGEAAAMALGHIRKMLIVTDDRPSMKVLANELTAQSCTSIELVRGGLALGILRKADASAAVAAALSNAHMAVHDCDLGWTVNLMGQQALAEHRHLGDLRRRIERQHGRG